MPLTTQFNLFTSKPQVSSKAKNSDCFLNDEVVVNPYVYAINFNVIFFVSFGSFCLKEPEAAFLAFANLSFIFSKSFFPI